MRADFKGFRPVVLAGLALALATGLAAQSTGKTATPASTPTAQPAPGTTPVGGDIPAPPDAKKPVPGKAPALLKTADGQTVNPDKVVAVGSDLIKVKPGSIEDVSAVGNRNIGGRGLGNWYSTDGEIKMGKQYADQIDKTVRFITDPVVDEYVNRIGQNIVRNSDCKVPFTIKVIDSDEINAFALPGGFFYINSGLILAADEEAELAAVMAHETAHVCAHHAAREMTRLNYAQIGMVPLIMMTGYSWTGYGIYEAAQLAVPVTFMEFSRLFEAQADYLGVQYMYRAGYDPQAMISFFEKIEALEKRKPGLVARVFEDHPQTPDRVLRTQEEIARILPPRDEYLVTTSEFDQVKARLARIENRRRLQDTKGPPKPSLRRASTGNPGGQTGDGDTNPTDQPTLHRRDDQN
jgi:predicted Zn-dependent protease